MPASQPQFPKVFPETGGGVWSHYESTWHAPDVIPPTWCCQILSWRRTHSCARSESWPSAHRHISGGVCSGTHTHPHINLYVNDQNVHFYCEFVYFVCLASLWSRVASSHSTCPHTCWLSDGGRASPISLPNTSHWLVEGSKWRGGWSPFYRQQLWLAVGQRSATKRPIAPSFGQEPPQSSGSPDRCLILTPNFNDFFVLVESTHLNSHKSHFIHVMGSRKTQRHWLRLQLSFKWVNNWEQNVKANNSNHWQADKSIINHFMLLLCNQTGFQVFFDASCRCVYLMPQLVRDGARHRPFPFTSNLQPL